MSAFASSLIIAAAAALGVGAGVWGVYEWLHRAHAGPRADPPVVARVAPQSPGGTSAPVPTPAPAPADTEVAVSQEEPAREPSARATPASDARRVSSPAGRLVVRSTPAGAMVTLDGRIIGETPLSAASLPLGTHALLIARPGFAPHVESITLSALTPSRTISVELEAGVRSIDRSGAPSRAPAPNVAAAARGAIDVDSRPRGARVTIDGRFAGTTPLRVPELPVGLHTVTIELEGHKTLTTRTAVEAGKAAVVKVTLELTGWR